MWKGLLIVAASGALGAVARWLLQRWVDGFGPVSGVPLGVLAANVLGCAAFGYIFGVGESRDWLTEGWRLALFTGFLGSFTTFSTFSWQTLELLRSGQGLLALTYVLVSIGAGLFAVWGGLLLAR
ncbi:MAG: fluoride efflux transporter CrcB [Verrucomicrobiota bacterium]